MLFAPKATKIDKYAQKKDSTKLVALLNDNKPEIRVQVIKALGMIGDEKSINALINLISSSDKAMRLEAIKSLGNTHNQTVKSHLQHLILAETDEEVKRITRESIAKIPNRDYTTKVI